MSLKQSEYKIKKIPLHQIPRSVLKSLEHIQKPLKTLYAQGSQEAFQLLKKLPTHGLAVVGTRKASFRSKEFLKFQLKGLRNSNFVIVSGLARGIDEIAHQSALENNLPTIAFLGSGHNVIYPRETFDLKIKILQNNGLLLTEYSPGENAKKFHFIERNRLIAAFSQATLVAEAPIQSGALHTARWAWEMDHDCYAFPGFPEDPLLLGNQKLLENNKAIPFWSVKSLWKTWPNLKFEPSQQLNLFPHNTPSTKTQKTDPVLKFIHEKTYQNHGVSFEDLYDWGIKNNISKEIIFSKIHHYLNEKSIYLNNGLLIAIQAL